MGKKIVRQIVAAMILSIISEVIIPHILLNGILIKTQDRGILTKKDTK